ncbi:hypothetical protein M408DRAFT_326656 [Serendipita vermifera MAFF 305830]|uniref:Uncharacterized protein n=1 Tax=Serendipita vermifera MAFF 305830 TaxID=933852 RepID=A0A0C3B837_SERVB|nr:hypothetical protein M408DRAFT_326656 [Serendipita vermifera MAFF 305830]
MATTAAEAAHGSSLPSPALSPALLLTRLLSSNITLSSSSNASAPRSLHRRLLLRPGHLLITCPCMVTRTRT